MRQHNNIKERIIDRTRQLIMEHGIRSVRVDEIAHVLNISKRTLYELFLDKTDLVNECLSDMQKKQREKVTHYMECNAENSLQNAIWLMHEYINNLYSANCGFLTDLKIKADFAEKFQENGKFWREQMGNVLHKCLHDGFILPKADITAIINLMMYTLFELRIEGMTRIEQECFAETLLRGLATRKGIEFIDSIKPYYSETA